MMNRATLVGHVGRDPETRCTQAGDPVCSFSLATGERWKDKTTGEDKERTEWHQIVIWNEGLIGIVERFVKKGSRILVEGQIRTRDYEKDNVKHYRTEIVLSGFDSKVVLLDRAERAPPPSENPHGPGAPARTSAPAMAGAGKRGYMDDEIPF